ncbi:hypothetical protein [Micromonospora sp. WMMD812]|uniref:hypothetical protein n=1 Tax=Micromonospora sp. WMMD812 TaxID=3015152 RepID=UPI00248D056E|nr:hypothetical protein [Micromonospora sp. WMMD812]WBB65097.1 hypothetical protein O7603_17910 [Micromonospora sp. WMMD812]
MPAAAGVIHHRRIGPNPPHMYAYDLVDGRYEPVADAAEELIVDKPFDIRDVTP